MVPAKRELYITATLTALTITASILTTAQLAQQLDSAWPQSSRAAVEIIAFYAIAISLLYGNLVYQITRVGYWQRRLAKQPQARAERNNSNDIWWLIGAAAVIAVCMALLFLVKF